MNLPWFDSALPTTVSLGLKQIEFGKEHVQLKADAQAYLDSSGFTCHASPVQISFQKRFSRPLSVPGEKLLPVHTITITFINFLLLAGNISALETIEFKKYLNRSLGVSFDYPAALVIDEKSSRQDPLSVVFNHGAPPFSVSILFKEIAGSANLEAFAKEERKRQEQGGYRDQIEEKKYTMEGNIAAIEFVRTSALGTIYYYIFPSQQSGRLLAFWHMTSKSADPEEKAVAAYHAMKKSVRFPKP